MFGLQAFCGRQNLVNDDKNQIRKNFIYFICQRMFMNVNNVRSVLQTVTVSKISHLKYKQSLYLLRVFQQFEQLGDGASQLWQLFVCLFQPICQIEKVETKWRGRGCKCIVRSVRPYCVKHVSNRLTVPAKCKITKMV